MKKSEVIERRDNLRYKSGELTLEEYKEYAQLSDELIGMYASIIDLDEIDDDEMEGALNG